MNKAIFNIVVIWAIVIGTCAISEAQTIEHNTPLIIRTLNQKGAPEKALEIINNGSVDLVKNNNFKFAVAENYYGLKDYKAAANLYLELTQENIETSNYELAKCYAQLNKPDLATKFLRNHLESKNRLMQRTIKSEKAFFAIDKSKEWVDLWQTEWYSKYDLMLEDAWFEYNAGNYEETLKQLDYLNDIRKSLVDAYYLKTLAYLKVGEPENALIAINSAIDKRYNKPIYFAAKAQVEIALKKGKKALVSINSALLLDSTQIEFFFIRSKAYLLAGKVESAKADLNALMKLVPDFEVYKLAGEIFYESGEYHDALRAYNKCIELEKYNFEMYITRADVFAKTQGYEFAEKDYSFALDFKPYDGELYYKRGLARKYQHKANLACQDFEKAYKYKYMKADQELRTYCQDR